ncbi:MAG TPA: sigma-54 dependent transcriptional regulator [Candidatus Binataceae bacterium]|nr:sigma-54 dependent transcriptional regulator [Candidatus Binataceae bacterium]
MKLNNESATFVGDTPAVEIWRELDELSAGCEERSGMVVRSEEMRRVCKTIERLGPYKATVLVHGESGTGKELVARALHALGPVPKGPFVTFNCSNLLESLAESQLFGHVKGAFTDARDEALGYFRSANGGTLFLDEIGELPLRLQPKLLRAVETHEVQPVGSAQSHKVDIRLIAATNRDLKAMVRAGTFRDDLYYRLSATTITIPPLRDRGDALDALAAHFIKHYDGLFGKDVRWISQQALDALHRHDWPGNVREFSHAIQSAVMLTDSDRIGLADLPEHLAKAEVPEAPVIAATPAPRVKFHTSNSARLSLDDAVNHATKSALLRALHETGGNCFRAAQLLGISRYTVYRMITRYGLTREIRTNVAPQPSSSS